MSRTFDFPPKGQYTHIHALALSLGMQTQCIYLFLFITAIIFSLIGIIIIDVGLMLLLPSTKLSRKCYTLVNIKIYPWE